MITACLIIIAWAASLPLWASITITVLASVKFLVKFLMNFLEVLDDNKKN